MARLLRLLPVLASCLLPAVAASVFAQPGVTAAVDHGLMLVSMKIEMLLFIALCIAVFSAPLLLFRGELKRARSQALLDYGALVVRQGGLVHARWIERRPIDDQPLLDSPELGPVADTNALYDAVKAMRTVPLGKSSVMPIVVAAALPMLAVLALQVPVADLLKRLAHAVL